MLVPDLCEDPPSKYGGCLLKTETPPKEFGEGALVAAAEEGFNLQGP